MSIAEELDALNAEVKELKQTIEDLHEMMEKRLNPLELAFLEQYGVEPSSA